MMIKKIKGGLGGWHDGKEAMSATTLSDDDDFDDVEK